MLTGGLGLSSINLLRGARRASRAALVSSSLGLCRDSGAEIARFVGLLSLVALTTAGFAGGVGSGGVAGLCCFATGFIVAVLGLLWAGSAIFGAVSRAVNRAWAAAVRPA